jgi:hypothetical protein
MASETARAALNKVVGALNSIGAPFALIGGLALAVWSYPRATRDVDVLIGVDELQVQSIIDEMVKIGCRPKHTPAINFVGQHSFLHLLYTPPGEFYDVQFDLLLATTPLEKTALERSVIRDVPGVSRPIYVLNCDDLILFKLLSGRLIDLADAAMLLRENRDSIDLEYTGSAIERLDLVAAFSSTWREAFPGELIPAELAG